MNQTLNWGILATGRIAGTFARALKLSKQGKLIAVASRTQEAADTFGKEHDVPHCHGSYQALLDDPDVHAIYISTPHPMHLEWAVKAAQAKKHILCEKPVSMNEREARAMVGAARDNDICFMEAFMYRFHPQTHKVIELIKSGVIGEVRAIHGSYGFMPPYDPAGRLFNKALGGGGILDVGCYPVSYTRMLAGVATGKDHSVDPIDLQAVGHLGATGVDEWTSAVARFPGDILAQWNTGVQLQWENGLKILGSHGRIHLPHAFHPCYWGGEGKIIINHTPFTTPVQEITIKADKPLFTIAIDGFTDHCLRGDRQVTFPAMNWEDSAGNMRTLDRWRKAIGLQFDCDL